MPRSVELLSNEAPIPAENGVWFGHLRDLMQRFAAKPLGDLGQGSSLRIRQPQPGGQLGAENAILGDQVLVAQQQFLVDQSGHERQQPCPKESIAHGGTLMITDIRSTADPPGGRTSIFTERALEITVCDLRFCVYNVRTMMYSGCIHNGDWPWRVQELRT